MVFDSFLQSKQVTIDQKFETCFQRIYVFYQKNLYSSLQKRALIVMYSKIPILNTRNLMT